MSGTQESWKDVASKVEALGLKLKLHLEQEADDAADDKHPGDTKAAVEDLGTKLQDAFESFGNAAKDPAVHSDVKDIGNLLKDALVQTFNAVGAEVGEVIKKAEQAGEAAGDKITDAIGSKDTEAAEIVDTVADDVAGPDA